MKIPGAHLQMVSKHKQIFGNNHASAYKNVRGQNHVYIQTYRQTYVQSDFNITHTHLTLFARCRNTNSFWQNTENPYRKIEPIKVCANDSPVIITILPVHVCQLIRSILVDLNKQKKKHNSKLSFIIMTRMLCLPLLFITSFTSFLLKTQNRFFCQIRKYLWYFLIKLIYKICLSFSYTSYSVNSFII